MESWNPLASSEAADKNAETLTAEDVAARKTASYNAFAKQYGVGPAGDPEAAAQLQALALSQQVDPLKVQEAQRENAAGNAAVQTYGPMAGNPEAYSKNVETQGKVQSNAQDVAMDPLLLQAQKTKTAADALSLQEQPTKFAADTAEAKARTAQGYASANALGAEAGKTRQETAMTAGNADTQAQLGMVNQLLAVRNSGGDVQAAFDKLAPTIEQLPGVSKQHIEGLRAQVANPGVLENLSGALGNAAIAQKGMVKLPYNDGSGYALVPASSVPKSAVGQQAYVDRRTGQVGQRTVNQSQSPQAMQMAQSDLKALDNQYGRTSDALGKAIGLVNGYSTGLGGETVGRIPGSDKTKLQAQVDTAKANIALLAANMSRQGGKSVAIPVRNLQEFKAYQDSLGAVNLNAPADTVRGQLEAAQQNLHILQNAVHDNYRAKYGDAVVPQQQAPAAQNGGAAPPPGLQLPPGFKYIGPAQ